VTDLETGVVQTTNYATAFPYTGMVTSQTKVANGEPIGTTTNSFTSGTGGDCGAHTAGTVYCITLASTVVQGWELSTTAGTPGAALPTVETDYAGYDAYGNVGTVTVNTTPATGGSPDVTKVTTNTWQNIVDANHWLLGRLTEADVTATYAGQSTRTRHSAYTYDTGTGLLTSETVEPGGAANVTVTTSYLYDGFGNKHVVTVTGGDTAPCATQTDYDTRGQFPVTVTNCIGEHETYSYLQPFSAAFGFADSHTGPNGLTTHWSYDSFGRQTQELRPDGTRSTVSYQYCSGTNGGSDANCPSHGAFSVYTSVQGSDGATQIAPNGRSFFDGLSRALAADAQGFDGSWIRTSTLYDAFGRVSKSSRPYFLAAQNPCAAGSGTYCSTFTYDTLGRVTKALQPNGGFTLTSYQGLTTVSTLRDFRLDGTFVNEVTTTLKNDLGAPATVTDAAGATTTFTYDALGEALTITDTLGHLLANNTYDQRGRKTESHDADMGHWTYQYNSLGQLTSQTDAVGNVVTMTYDTLGRMLTRNEGAAMSSVWIYGNASNQGHTGTRSTSSCRRAARARPAAPGAQAGAMAASMPTTRSAARRA
jgi:YD repeat-containing protein